MATVIALLNQKGGVGRTTASVNLCRGLILKEYKTLLVDTDPQGTARKWHEASNGSLIECIGIDRDTIPGDIEKLRKNYDVILIDGAPRIAKLMASSIRACDVVIIPIQPTPHDIRATHDLVELIKCRQEVTDGLPKAAFLISRLVKNTILSNEIEDALQEYGFPILKNKISQTVAFPMADRALKSIFCEKSSASQDFMLLVEEVISSYIDIKTS